MKWRGLSHDKLADRMQEMGFGWDRKHVHRLLDPGHESRLTVEQWYGLALALETTLSQLLSTWPADPKDRTPVVEVVIGDMPSIWPDLLAEIMLEDKSDRFLEQPAVTVDFERSPVEWAKHSSWTAKGEIMRGHIVAMPNEELLGFLSEVRGEAMSRGVIRASDVPADFKLPTIFTISGRRPPTDEEGVE